MNFSDFEVKNLNHSVQIVMQHEMQFVHSRDYLTTELHSCFTQMLYTFLRNFFFILLQSQQAFPVMTNR